MTDSLLEIGRLLKATRKDLGLTQEQVADLAGLSRPRYREIETGCTSARTTTLINVARALGLELILVPQATVPAINSLLQPNGSDDDAPAFVASPERNTDA